MKDLIDVEMTRGVITVAFVACFKRVPSESEIAERMEIIERANVERRKQ